MQCCQWIEQQELDQIPGQYFHQNLQTTFETWKFIQVYKVPYSSLFGNGKNIKFERGEVNIMAVGENIKWGRGEGNGNFGKKIKIKKNGVREEYQVVGRFIHPCIYLLISVSDSMLCNNFNKRISGCPAQPCIQLLCLIFYCYWCCCLQSTAE